MAHIAIKKVPAIPAEEAPRVTITVRFSRFRNCLILANGLSSSDESAVSSNDPAGKATDDVVETRCPHSDAPIFR